MTMPRQAPSSSTRRRHRAETVTIARVGVIAVAVLIALVVVSRVHRPPVVQSLAQQPAVPAAPWNATPRPTLAPHQPSSQLAEAESRPLQATLAPSRRIEEHSPTPMQMQTVDVTASPPPDSATPATVPAIPSSTRPAAIPWPALSPVVAATPDPWALPAFELEAAGLLPALPGWSATTAPAHAWRDSPAAVRVGWIDVPNPMVWWPNQAKPERLRVDVAVPVDGSGRPLPGAADLVAVVPWQQIPSGLFTDYAVQLCRRGAFTVFSPRFGGPTWGQVDDQRHFFRFPTSGSDAAWLAAAAAVRQVLGTPERKLFVWGQSVGGSAAAWFADAKPQHVEALGFEGAGWFTPSPRFAGPVLSLQPVGDSSNADQQTWQVSRPKGAGAVLTQVRYRPNFAARGQNNDTFMAHMTPPDVRPVVVRWFAAIADQRLRNRGSSTLSTAAWIKNPIGLLPDRGVQTALADMVSPVAALGSRADDAGLRVARPGAGVTPRAVILIVDGDLGTRDEDLDWDLLMLAERGWLAFGARSGADPAATLLARRLTAIPSGPPVVLVRIGDCGDPSRLIAALGKRLVGDIAIPVRGMTFVAGTVPDTVPRLALQPPTGRPFALAGAWTEVTLGDYKNYAGRRAMWMRTVATAVRDLLSAPTR